MSSDCNFACNTLHSYGSYCPVQTEKVTSFPSVLLWMFYLKTCSFIFKNHWRMLQTNRFVWFLILSCLTLDFDIWYEMFVTLTILTIFFQGIIVQGILTLAFPWYLFQVAQYISSMVFHHTPLKYFVPFLKQVRENILIVPSCHRALVLKRLSKIVYYMYTHSQKIRNINSWIIPGTQGQGHETRGHEKSAHILIQC